MLRRVFTCPLLSYRVARYLEKMNLSIEGSIEGAKRLGVTDTDQIINDENEKPKKVEVSEELSE